MTLINLQLGKKGLTDEFIENVRLLFKEADNIRISVLKSSTRDKEELKQWAERIVASLGEKFTYKTIGYTITLRKWRKAREK